MNYLNCYRIKIDFLLNYFISLLQSSSYKNQDYANDEVCLFHLFLLSLPAIPCSHAMEREGIAKCFFFVFVFRYLILALSLSLSKFVFGCLLAFFGLVGLFVLSSLTSHTPITHKHILTHTHKHRHRQADLSNQQGLRCRYMQLSISFACMFVYPITNLLLI